MSIGGFSFEVGNDLIPFDWDAFSISEEEDDWVDSGIYYTEWF